MLIIITADYLCSALPLDSAQDQTSSLLFFFLPYCPVTAEMLSALSLSGVAVSAGRSVYTVVSAEASSAGLTRGERHAVCRDQSGAKAEPRAG